MRRNHHRDEEAARRRRFANKLFYFQLQQSEQLKPSPSVYMQDTVQKGESQDRTRLKKKVGPVLVQPKRVNLFSSRQTQLESYALEGWLSMKELLGFRKLEIYDSFRTRKPADVLRLEKTWCPKGNVCD